MRPKLISITNSISNPNKRKKKYYNINKDKIEFIESMIEPQFNKIAEFAQSAPSLSYTHNKDDVEFTLTGLNDFFSLVSLT